MDMDKIIGRKIIAIRPMTKVELRLEGWSGSGGTESGMAIVLESGVKLYPSRDDEGNGPGALFGYHLGRHFNIV